MNDRLQDLYNASTSGDNFTETELVEVAIDVDQLSEVPAGLQDFTERVEKLKTAIVQLKSNIETLTSGYRSVLVSVDSTAQDELNRKLEDQIEASIKEIAADLKTMGSENQEASEHARWRINVHSHLTKRFMDVMIQYRGLQSDHREKVQERIRQRLQIVKPDATPEQIQHVVDGGKLNVFADQLYSENQAQAKDALTYVEGRHRELLKIEASVNELHRLFLDMAILVNAQGEFIDNIEANVAQSGAYIESANKDLIQARKKATRKRKCMFWSCIILVIIIAICLAIFLGMGSMKNWWSSSGM